MLPEACEHISECERDAESYERAIEDYNDAVMMSNHIGEVYEATVIDVSPAHFYIETNDKHIEGRVDMIMDADEIEELKSLTDKDEIESFLTARIKPFMEEYSQERFGYTRKGKVILRLGDKVIVSCINSNVEERQVDFALVRKL